MLRTVCRIITLFWAIGAVIGGLNTEQYGAAVMGVVVLCAMF